MTKKTLLAAALIFAATAAQAQEKQTSSSTFPRPTEVDSTMMAPHIGLLGGMTSPEGSYDSTGSVGLDAGFQPYVPFGVGAEATYYRANGDGATADLERTQVLAKASYNFGGDVAVIKHSYVGLGAGVVFEDSETELVSAPMVGFDIPLKQAANDYITLGANARYAITEGSSADAFTVNGAVKYWY